MKRLPKGRGGLAALFIPILIVAGCGGPDLSHLPQTVPAKGLVTLDGTPIEGATILFASDNLDSYPAFASSDKNGRFTMRIHEAREGAVPGIYKVTVTKTVEAYGVPPAQPVDLGEDAEHAATSPILEGVYWQNDLPKKYENVATTDLTVEVPANGRDDIQLELVSS